MIAIGTTLTTHRKDQRHRWKQLQVPVRLLTIITHIHCTEQLAITCPDMTKSVQNRK